MQKLKYETTLKSLQKGTNNIITLLLLLLLGLVFSVRKKMYNVQYKLKRLLKKSTKIKSQNIWKNVIGLQERLRNNES